VVELMIVLALSSVIAFKAAVLLSSTNEALRGESESLTLEDHARMTLDRIAMAVMSCDRDALAPILSPGHSTGVRYQVSLGVEAGAVVWSDPEEIELTAENGVPELVWRRNPGAPEEENVVWSRRVQPLLEGEAINGVDDNGNGLVDEEGLNFVVDGNQVTIRLSLGVTFEDGERVTRSLESIVTVRNNPLP
jgi:hypothetical protein